MLKTKVKASSVTHLTDARYFAAWEVEWLGFNLSSGDPEAIDPRQAAAIQGWIDGVQIVGELNLPTVEDLQTATELLSLDAIQVGMYTETETLREWGGQLPIIQEIVINADTQLEEVEELLEAGQGVMAYFLMNFTKGDVTWVQVEQGVSITVEQLKEWAERYPLLLEIDLNDQRPSTLLDQLPILGFSLRGGAEEKVGYKNFDELDTFFEDLEVLI